MKITNKEIYEKIEELIDANQKQHNEIIQHQIKTNGKVKLNRWIATTALTLLTTVIFLLIGYLIQNGI